MSEKLIPFTAYEFQQYLNQGELKASRCVDCQKIYLPVRAICPDCGRSNLEWIELSGKGKLAAYTSIYIGPSFMNALGFGRDKPYLTGIVELDEGPKISARLLGLDPENPSEIKIGTALEYSGIEIGDEDHISMQLAFKAGE
jgi:uncharacterized OB-fold protein